METIQYPEQNCCKEIKDFVDTLNKVLVEMKAIVIDKYYLSQNGVHNCIYKIMVSQYDCLACEVCLIEATETRFEELTSKIKHVKFDRMYNPRDIDIYNKFTESKLKSILDEIKPQYV